MDYNYVRELHVRLTCNLLVPDSSAEDKRTGLVGKNAIEKQGNKLTCS